MERNRHFNLSPFQTKKVHPCIKILATFTSKKQGFFAYRSSHVDFALADDKLMDNILVTIPAGKLERSPTIFSLLVYIAFHWHQHSDDTSMAI